MSVVSCGGVENLLSNSNLSSFSEMAIYTYKAVDQSVCWYVACVVWRGCTTLFNWIKNIT